MEAAVTQAPGILSPCNKVCTMDRRVELCMGCGRNGYEIANWLHFSDGERAQIMAGLQQRMREAYSKAATQGDTPAKAEPASEPLSLWTVVTAATCFILLPVGVVYAVGLLLAWW